MSFRVPRRDRSRRRSFVLFPAWAEHEMQYDYPRFVPVCKPRADVEMDFRCPSERTALLGASHAAPSLRRSACRPIFLSSASSPENYEKLAANTVRTVNSGQSRETARRSTKSDHRNLPSRRVNERSATLDKQPVLQQRGVFVRGAGLNAHLGSGGAVSARSHPMPRASR